MNEEECKVCGNVKREDGSCPTCNGAPKPTGDGGQTTVAEQTAVAGLPSSVVAPSPLEQFRAFLNDFGLRETRLKDGSISRPESLRGYNRAMRDAYEKMEGLGLI
jgi:hypothetical protein